ncbi:hypothetical protein DLM78_11780 [Leptospira stimsonii]|uniref:Uncharacterized protein n=1 Tax=Leptospira stimsonii TaxID=2202203 RepID=A0A8B3CQN6_9LEPT|nr:hypothetical protein DLM78_11780 [Leptospira stimsonii]
MRELGETRPGDVFSFEEKDTRVNRNVARGTPEFYFPKEVFFLRLIFKIRELLFSLSKSPENPDAEFRDNT